MAWSFAVTRLPLLAHGTFSYNVAPETWPRWIKSRPRGLVHCGLVEGIAAHHRDCRIEKICSPRNWKQPMAKPREFKGLVAYLQKIPAMSEPIHWQRYDDGTWSVGFSLALEHPLAWSAVQELAYVLNTLSVSELLPTRFLPTAPPPYLNGPACWYLSWRIESTLPGIKPDEVLEWLEGRLPQPVDDESKWLPSIAEECESPDAEV